MNVVAQTQYMHLPPSLNWGRPGPAGDNQSRGSSTVLSIFILSCAYAIVIDSLSMHTRHLEYLGTSLAFQ